MSDYTEEIPIPDTKLGDRWIGVASIGPVTFIIPPATDPLPHSEPLDRIRMTFKHPKGLLYVLDSDTTDERSGPIVIDNAVTWLGHIDPVDDFLPHDGEWSWDMEFYYGGHASPLTLYKGTLSVTNDVR